MASKNTIVVIRGKLHWAKIIGEPRMNTFTEEREWSLDLTPDKAGRAVLKANGVSDKLKEPKDNDKRKESFLTLRQKEYRTDPVTKERVKNLPIRITDAQGDDWPEGKLLGNETIADIKVAIPPKVAGRPRGIYIQAVRVLKLNKYDGGNDFAPLSADDEFFGAAYEGETSDPADEEASTESVAQDEDFDDEIPF